MPHHHPIPNCFAPVLLAQILTASQPKYGHPDLTAAPLSSLTPTVPMKFYLTYFTGLIDDHAHGDTPYSTTKTYDPTTGAETDTDATAGGWAGDVGEAAVVVTNTATEYTGHSVPNDDGEQSFTITVTDENTTDAVQALATSALGDFTGTFTESAVNTTFAELTIPDSEVSVQVTRARYKFRIKPVPSCHLKAKWTERFTPSDGSATSDTAREEEWHGTGDPCYAHGGFSWDDDTTWPALDNSGAGYYECAIPATRGTLAIVDLQFTCIPGAEPTGEGKPGFMPT